MDGFTQALVAVVERRLPELGSPVAPLPAGDLRERFGREEVAAVELHYELQLAGEPFALTVTPFTQQQADEYTPMQPVDEQIGRLRPQRIVGAQQVIVAPRGTVFVDVVGPPRGGDDDAALDSASQAFAESLLDHDAVEPLLQA